MLEAAESSKDADWHDLGCCQKAAPSHLPSPCLLSARVWYGSIFFFICFPRKTQQNTICHTVPVYKGNEKDTFTLSSPFLWRTAAPY